MSAVKKQLAPIAQSLRAARAKAGISQRALADAAGVSKPTIANIERGTQTSVRVLTLEKMASALDCSVADLMGAGASNDETLVAAFLSSDVAQGLKLTAKEKAWLKALRINWDDGGPSAASLLFMLMAYRNRS